MMNTDILNPKGIVFLLVSILIVTWGTQSISYAQEADPTLTVSVEEPLTEANLNGSTVTLTLSSGRFVDQMWHIEAALSISGIDGVTIGSWFYFQRVSATEVIIPLTFSGNIDTDVTLTFTVGALAIPGYNGSALTATLPVTAIQESLEASTESPLTDLTLHRSVVTLTLSGRIYEQSIFSIEDAVMVSGIEGVTFDGFFDLDRISDTEVTVELKFSGNIDTDATLTFTVGAGAIAGYDGSALTATLPVTTIEEPLVASTEFLLTEANLDGSTITLTLTGVRFVDDEDDIGRGHTVSVSGIEGVYIKGGWFSADVSRMSDTEVT
ncbi:hypothetical protein F4Y93_06805, partial [Candidatus Poribacteria bacterium]|nr:hypothetical protein [Candidatus Poribacteria bacterium]